MHVCVCVCVCACVCVRVRVCVCVCYSGHIFLYPGTNYYRNRVIKVAKEFTGKLTFAIASWDVFGHEVNEFGFEKGSNPVVGVQDAKGMKYKMTADYR